MSHATQAAQTAKAHAELFLTEKQLARLGEDMEEANHPLGRDGQMPADDPGIARERKIERTTGTTPQGEVDTTTVTEEDAVPGQPVELEGPSPVKDQIARAEDGEGDDGE